MAAGSLFQQGEISVFYTHLAVALAEVSTVVSVICWDSDPCQWKNNIFFVSNSSKNFWQLSVFLLLHKQCFPFFWGHKDLDFSKSVPSGCVDEYYWQSILLSSVWTETKKHFLYLLSNVDIIIRRLMTNKINWLALITVITFFNNSSLLFDYLFPDKLCTIELNGKLAKLEKKTTN